MKNNLKKGDLLIFLLIALVGGWLILLPKWWSASGALAEVSVDGEIVAQIPLLGKDETILIEENGVSFTLARKDNAIAMKRIDCPDRICIRTGYIKTQGEMIVCLPNRVSILVVDDKEGEVDLIAG